MFFICLMMDVAGAKTFQQIVQIKRLNKNRQKLCRKKKHNKKGNMSAFAYTYTHTYRGTLTHMHMDMNMYLLIFMPRAQNFSLSMRKHERVR